MQRWERIDHREFFNGENSVCQRSKMKDDAHETYIRAKQKAQHQVKIVLDQLRTNYGFRQYEIMPQERDRALEKRKSGAIKSLR